MGFIFILSSIPGGEIPSTLSSYDKLIHFFVYLTLGFNLYVFFKTLKFRLDTNSSWISRVFLYRRQWTER